MLLSSCVPSLLSSPSLGSTSTLSRCRPAARGVSLTLGGGSLYSFFFYTPGRPGWRGYVAGFPNLEALKK